MAEIPSSQGLTPARPPRLRQIAEMVEEQAAGARDPARARALARRMRLRAAELELGTNDLTLEADEAIETFQELAFELDAA